MKIDEAGLVVNKSLFHAEQQTLDKMETSKKSEEKDETYCYLSLHLSFTAHIYQSLFVRLPVIFLSSVCPSLCIGLNLQYILSLTHAHTHLPPPNLKPAKEFK